MITDRLWDAMTRVGAVSRDDAACIWEEIRELRAESARWRTKFRACEAEVTEWRTQSQQYESELIETLRNLAQQKTLGAPNES
ncbi:hypothetical protein EH165_00980 [Nakamurella antarctica]|uniref:Uncharacterized protein n=1 Tax=Nakamurella antarctica TaxID=1902245 RepID=A0A3G8ZJD9_9ACTN|nr:hypothetical protein [Nakamurella antarctica]AZI56955.1 hypothetical protein EH165_00980 [Nakamurella antarctica]